MTNLCIENGSSSYQKVNNTMKVVFGGFYSQMPISVSRLLVILVIWLVAGPAFSAMFRQSHSREVFRKENFGQNEVLRQWYGEIGSSVCIGSLPCFEVRQVSSRRKRGPTQVIGYSALVNFGIKERRGVCAVTRCCVEFSYL